jgi:hypothetical protein
MHVNKSNLNAFIESSRSARTKASMIILWSNKLAQPLQLQSPAALLPWPRKWISNNRKSTIYCSLPPLISCYSIYLIHKCIECTLITATLNNVERFPSQYHDRKSLPNKKVNTHKFQPRIKPKKFAYTISWICSEGVWGSCQGSLKVLGPIKYILWTWLWDSPTLFVSKTWPLHNKHGYAINKYSLKKTKYPLIMGMIAIIDIKTRKPKRNQQLE